MSSRANRRHHRERLNKRTRKLLKSRSYFSMYSLGWEEDIEYSVNRRRDNLHGCSCYMCCNPRSRKSFAKQKLTIQELKAIADERDQWLEVD